MTGKQKCRILKEIRAQIARENDIDLVIEECAHKGKCRGTCPRCESEVRYLERELERRRSLKKRVALAGVSAGVTLALSGCTAVVDALFGANDGTPPAVVSTAEPELEGAVSIDEPDDVLILDGEVAGPEDVLDAVEGDVPEDMPDVTEGEVPLYAPSTPPPEEGQ